MASRRLVPASVREALLGIPSDIASLERNYLLADDDLDLIGTRRRPENRLGLALHIALLRHPGQGWHDDTEPPAPLVVWLAEQIEVPLVGGQDVGILDVSIRAPARGATRLRDGHPIFKGFQSAPPHGERPGALASSVSAECFNPRPRTGSDHLPGFGRCVRNRFNPRPRTGSDCGPSSSTSKTICFNPRPRTGSDVLPGFMVGMYFQFQSAPPHGERRAVRKERVIGKGFNPRPRTGSDRRGLEDCPRHGCFNPRPRTGSDPLPHLEAVKVHVFQSAPPHGERLAGRCDVGHGALVSIRAPARGATTQIVFLDSMKVFQSAPPHGERRARW